MAKDQVKEQGQQRQRHPGFIIRLADVPGNASRRTLKYHDTVSRTVYEFNKGAYLVDEVNGKRLGSTINISTNRPYFEIADLSRPSEMPEWARVAVSQQQGKMVQEAPQRQGGDMSTAALPRVRLEGNR